jgi:MFS family permease
MLPSTSTQDIPGSQIRPRQKVWTVGTLTYTRAGLALLFFWLLWGDFGWAMKDRGVYAVVMLLLKKFSASDFLVGTLFGSLPTVIASVLCPIVSYKSDRHRGRSGRRIPFILVLTPIAVVSMTGLGFSPFLGERLHALLGAHSPGREALVLLFLGVFWLVFSFCTITANTLFSGLINDTVPHELLGRFFGAFRALSLIAGMIFNYWLFGKAEAGYLWIFLGMAILYGGGCTSMCLNVKEGQYPAAPPPGPQQGVVAFFVATKAYLKECFGKPYFLWYFTAINLSWLAFTPTATYSIFYAADLHVDPPAYGKCVTLTYLFSLFLSYPLGVLADRLHPLRAAMGLQFIFILVTLGSGFFVRDASSFSICLVVGGVIGGAWMTVVASLGQKLLPKENFTQLTAAGALLGSVLNIAVPPLVGLFLDYHHHNYRYTFFISAFIATLALASGFVVHHKFMQLGGPKNFVPPE